PRGGGSCPRRLRSGSGSARPSPAPARSGPDGPGTRSRSDACWFLVDIGRGGMPRARIAPGRSGWTPWGKVSRENGSRALWQAAGPGRKLLFCGAAGDAGGAAPRSPRAAAPGGRGGSGDLVGVGREALATAALGGGPRVAEGELLVQPLLHEVHLGAVDQRQAVGVDEDADPVLLEHRVPGLGGPGQVDGVAPAGAAGAADAEAQAEGGRFGGEVALDAVQGGGCEGDGHGPILPAPARAGPRT